MYVLLCNPFLAGKYIIQPGATSVGPMPVGPWKSPVNGYIDYPQGTYVTTLSSQQLSILQNCSK